MRAVDEFSLVGFARSIEDYDRLAVRADVVLLDLHLPGKRGAEGVSHVRGTGPLVLVISAAGTQDDVIDAIAAGASGYLTKDAEGDEIVRAVRLVSEGNTYVSPTLASFLLTAARKDTTATALSEREREVLALVASGETDQDIADALFISVKTVRSHLDRIRDKTGARRRADLTRYAIDNRIVPRT